MNKQLRTILIVSLLALLTAACGDAAESTAFDEAGFGGDAAAPADIAVERRVEAEGEAVVEEAQAVADSDIGVTTNQTAVTAQTQERLIIRTAELDIIVDDTDTAMSTITAMVEENGGWVVSSNLFQYSENAKTGTLQVRVPSTGFNSAVAAIRRLALEVERESSSGQDVTDEFVDLSSRLENLEATAARVRAFLDETRNVEEALAVNQELSRLEGEIEVIKGRIQYLSQSAAFSTIIINLTPDAISQPIEVGGWRPEGIAKDAVEALVDALQLIATALIWIGIFVLPIALIILLPGWIIVRLWRRRRAHRAAAAAE